MKKKIYIFLNENRTFIIFIYSLIFLNVIAIILQSYDRFDSLLNPYFEAFEIFSVAIFTIEYFLRIWSADLSHSFKGKSFVKRIKFIFSFYGIIDLLAILPFYLPFFISIDLRFIRMLRIFRLLRVFKISRYSRSFKLISNVLKETKEELLISVFVVLILLIFSATLMFHIENAAQPEKFQSVGDALWWSISTLTTVGYGDIYPVTEAGRFFSAVIAILGIGFVALPTGIISSEFIKIFQKNNAKEDSECVCPKCGTKFHRETKNTSNEPDSDTDF